jgi:carboxymethylenebutenolidase
MPGSIVKLEVDGAPMSTYLAVPDGEGPFPAIALGQHRLGIDVFMRTMCDRLAEAGFAAAAPDLYHRSWTPEQFDEVTVLPRGDDRAESILRPLAPQMLDEEIVHDMNAALAMLKEQPQVGSVPLGVLGFCMGGRVAYLMATRNSRLKATACFYPGNVFTPRGGGPAPFAASDRIMSPIIGHFGKLDTGPSPEDMARIDKELTRLQIEHEFHDYDDVAHAFMDPTSAIYSQAVADDAWAKTLTFLNAKLKP